MDLIDNQQKTGRNRITSIQEKLKDGENKAQELNRTERAEDKADRDKHGLS